ncbi:N-formylglutamate amidohydrolase [Rhodococcus koreensis]|uniref:N-formylglutamate amidohydrolase n=1 Tax=Rhodococcus koreensis TaxID=99653 RepID=UPI00367272B4
MPARPDNLIADAALPSLATDDASANPHILAAAARTETDIELRIHTSITPFDVATEQWSLATAGFVVTVIVHTVDAATGGLRYLPPAEPAAWARTIFSTTGAAHGFFLGAVDPNTGTHRRGQLAYWLYLDTDRQPIPMPRQLVTCPHYLLPGLDGRAEITIPTTA